MFAQNINIGKNYEKIWLNIKHFIQQNITFVSFGEQQTIIVLLFDFTDHNV
jgi:hypothetical protein